MRTSLRHAVVLSVALLALSSGCGGPPGDPAPEVELPSALRLSDLEDDSLEAKGIVRLFNAEPEQLEQDALDRTPACRTLPSGSCSALWMPGIVPPMWAVYRFQHGADGRTGTVDDGQYTRLSQIVQHLEEGYLGAYCNTPYWLQQKKIQAAILLWLEAAKDKGYVAQSSVFDATGGCTYTDYVYTQGSCVENVLASGGTSISLVFTLDHAASGDTVLIRRIEGEGDPGQRAAQFAGTPVTLDANGVGRSYDGRLRIERRGTSVEFHMQEPQARPQMDPQWCQAGRRFEYSCSLLGSL